jgi:hypothetical protein
MFQVVTQQQVNRQRHTWPVFFEEFSQESKGFFVDKDTTNNSKTILFCESTIGPIGGAQLVKRDINTFDSKARDLISKMITQDEIWECHGVFFMIPDDSPIHENLDQFSSLCDQFYRGLYECLHTFATNYKVSHMLSLNFYEEHQDISFFGRWPFRFEIEVSHLFPKDDVEYVLGIMEMDSLSYREFQKAN